VPQNTLIGRMQGILVPCRWILRRILDDSRARNLTLSPKFDVRRVDKPRRGSGELKKEIKWWLKGRCCARGPPRRVGADVAPDGVAHPVFRAGSRWPSHCPP